MLDDGHSYETIVAKLAELGHPGFLTQNISRWKLNGYQQYLRRQEQLQDIKLRSESALDLLQHFVPSDQSPANTSEHPRTPTNGSGQLPINNYQLPFTNPTCERVHTPTNANSALRCAAESLLSFQLFETLLELSESDLPLDQKANLLYKLGRLHASITREHTRRDQHALDIRKYDDHRADIQAPPAEQIEPDHELTQAQTRSIVHKVDRLFGIKLKLPESNNPNASSPSPLNGLRANASAKDNSISAGVTGETLTLMAVSSKRAPTSANASDQLPITNCELPITNSASVRESACSSVSIPSNSSERDRTPPTTHHASRITNPNPIGEWPQPPGTIPVINVLGCIVGWAAHPEIPHAPDLSLRDPAANKAEPITCHGKTILWYDRNSQPRNCPAKYPIPGQSHFIPVINSTGTVIDWREWDDEWFSNLPAQNPRPLLTGGWRGQIIAWIDETKMNMPAKTNGIENHEGGTGT